MASGTEKRQRNKVTHTRWAADEFNTVSAKADAAGYTVGAYLRALGLGDAGPRAQRRPPADHRVLRQILGELGRTGNNLNQIARTLNTGGQPNLPELEAALAAYLEVRRAILEALGKDTGPEP